ncbi:unnamed protein product [Paramecium octaurelia]|uniref:Transmembrane protein n=1 Tax=Paramecium octaurelia TaxID=43137 RepID=A0A8S1W6K8_PAROT|nr:unnamed protein product [Paramecium octaurelia]
MQQQNISLIRITNGVSYELLFEEQQHLAKNPYLIIRLLISNLQELEEILLLNLQLWVFLIWLSIWRLLIPHALRLMKMKYCMQLEQLLHLLLVRCRRDLIQTQSFLFKKDDPKFITLQFRQIKEPRKTSIKLTDTETQYQSDLMRFKGENQSKPEEHKIYRKFRKIAIIFKNTSIIIQS